MAYHLQPPQNTKALIESTNPAMGVVVRSHVIATGITQAYPNLYAVARKGTYSFPPTVKHGHISPTYFELYFNRVEFIPNYINLGNIIADTVITGQLWNANTVSNRLKSIAYDKNTGLTIDLDTPIPHNFKAFESRDVVINVGMEGAPKFAIDATATFSKGVTKLKLEGQRLILFPFSPVGDYSERLEYLTTISPAFASEIRAKVRRTPRRTLKYKCHINYEQIKNLLALSKQWGFRKWGLPMWRDSVHFADVSKGQNTFSMDTSDMPVKVGDTVIIWQDAITHHTTSIQTVNSNSVILNDPVVSIMSNAYFVPLIFARAPQGVKVRQAASETYATVDVDFVEDSARILPYDNSFIEVDGKPIYQNPMTVRNGGSDYFKQEFATFDNQTANRMYMETEKGASRYGTLSWITATRDEFTQFMRFMDYCAGRYRSFYIEDRLDLLKLFADVTPTAQQIKVEFNQNYLPLTNVKLYLIVNDTYHVLTVTNFFKENGYIVGNLSAPIGLAFTVTDAYTLGRLIRVRLDSDSISFKHDGRQSTQISIPFRQPIQET